MINKNQLFFLYLNKNIFDKYSILSVLHKNLLISYDANKTKYQSFLRVDFNCENVKTGILNETLILLLVAYKTVLNHKNIKLKLENSLIFKNKLELDATINYLLTVILIPDFSNMILLESKNLLNKDGSINPNCLCFKTMEYVIHTQINDGTMFTFHKDLISSIV